MKRISAGPPLPPIGFAVPPDGAHPRVPLLIALGVAAALAALWIGIASHDMAVRAFTLPEARDVSFKWEARCCDANGNPVQDEVAR